MTNILKNRSVKWWAGCISCTALFLSIVGFAYMKMSFLITGVDLKVNINKSEGSIAQVKGNAYGATYLTLNGREINIDKDGSFNESLVLLPGLSVVKLDTEDQFGNTSEKKFEIVSKDSGNSFAINDVSNKAINIINKN